MPVVNGKLYRYTYLYLFFSSPRRLLRQKCTVTVDVSFITRSMAAPPSSRPRTQFNCVESNYIRTRTVFMYIKSSAVIRWSHVFVWVRTYICISVLRPLQNAKYIMYNFITRARSEERNGKTFCSKTLRWRYGVTSERRNERSGGEGNKIITILTFATNPWSLLLFFNSFVDPSTTLLEEFNEIKHNDLYNILNIRIDFKCNDVDQHLY